MNNKDSEIPVNATESNTYSTPDKSTVIDIICMAIKCSGKDQRKGI